MIFTHTPPINELPPLKAKNVNGKRFYEHLETKEAYPSITSVLSIRDKKGLHEWRQKVGEDVANHVMIQAANRGTAVHNMVEDYLNNVDLDQVEKYQKQLLKWKKLVVRLFILKIKFLIKDVDIDLIKNWFQKQK